jgi:serine/threonine protein kinase
VSDISDFLLSYDETLRQEVSVSDMPPGLTEWFAFDSCVKQRDGRAVYFVAQKSDGRRAVLRVTDTPAVPTVPSTPAESSRNSEDNAAAEGAILARLKHPAIPRVLGTWEYGGRGYLAREYFEGDDLGTLVRRHGPLSRERLLDIALQLCDILIYIHRQNPAVIHRDIKPENIILSDENSVKLIDFGIARDFKPEVGVNGDTPVAGTRPYMAPEQFGSEQTDGRADIYALSVVMIYMATGKPDKTGLRASYPYRELIPLIEKGIRKDRDQRFRTAAQLKRRIRCETIRES